MPLIAEKCRRGHNLAHEHSFVVAMRLRSGRKTYHRVCLECRRAKDRAALKRKHDKGLCSCGRIAEPNGTRCAFCILRQPGRYRNWYLRNTAKAKAHVKAWRRAQKLLRCAA